MKSVPTSIRELRRIPNHDWPYLEQAERFPFEPEAAGWTDANGWWLAELSFLAYVSRQDVARPILERVGFEGASWITRKGTHLFMARAKRFVVVAFRGTLVSEPRNLLTDARFGFEDLPGMGRVHRGFKDALDVVWEDVESRLREHAEGRRVWFTGHSLGAALATLAAARWGDPGAGLCTFGSPRVGDAAFADRFPLPDHPRVVHLNDLVTVLPPPIGYRHVGRVIHLKDDGTLDDGTGFRGRLARNLGRRIPGLLSRIARPGEAVDYLVQENVFTDHCPIVYAIRTWNHLEASRA